MELVLRLAKVMLEHSVKLCPYRLCDGVAACLGVACVLCAVQYSSELLMMDGKTVRNMYSVIQKQII
jgi:hypothetical protein